MSDSPAGQGGIDDFDFLVGSWTVTHRRLKRRLVGDQEWERFSGTNECRTILDGAGNLEELAMPSKGYTGGTLRLFDRERRVWSLYWASSQTGLLYPPVVGRFTNGVGEFFGDDVQDGTPVRVRFRWSRITATSAHWEQAFSTDGGISWETNWEMAFERREPSDENRSKDGTPDR